MKITINGKAFAKKYKTGVQRYCFEILKELDKLVKCEDIELVVPKYCEEKIEYKNIKIIRYGKTNINLWEQDDKKYIENISKKTIGHINVIENIIEPNNWINKNIKIREPGNRTRLVFLGVMNYKPNIEAVSYIINKILPKLGKEYTLEVIGPKIPYKLKKLETEQIKFSGYVNSAKVELENNDIFICPIFNRCGN